MICTRCAGTGFINTHQLPDEVDVDDHDAMRAWIADDANAPHDVQVCDCCGDGDEWHGKPSEHDEDRFGREGPCGYNMGLPECI